MRQLDLVAGTPGSLPPGRFARFVPVSGLAAYPRLARIGGIVVKLNGPGQWFAVEEGTQVTIDASSADALYLAWAKGAFIINAQDPKVEGWVAEVVDCAEERYDGDPLPRALRLLYKTENRAWDNAVHGRFSQGFDVRGFTDVFVDAWSTGADGFTLNAFSMCPDNPIGPSGGTNFGPGIGNSYKRLYFVDNATQGHTTASEVETSFGGGLLILQTTGDFPANGDINFAVCGRPR